MKKVPLYLFVGAFFLVIVNPLSALEKGPLFDAIKKITSDKIVKLAQDPLVINAVKEANKTATRSAEEIAQLDKRWMNIEGTDEWIAGFLSNECAKLLKNFQTPPAGERQMFAEIFVMDQQGCIVAETNKTSDFFQGDENKFVKSFADGKGNIFIDDANFDESSRSYSVQVSVPVIDRETQKAIGAMTVSVDLDAIGEQLL